MPLLNCCGFGRTISPDPQPIRLVDSFQPKARFALSSHSLTPVEAPQNARTIRETPEKAFDDYGPQISSVTSGHDLSPLHETADGVNRRHSSRKLHGLTGNGQMGNSCDSGIAERSLPKDSSATFESELLNMQVIEDGVYRQHSSRALHGVAGKIRKRMSRDSGMSRRSSKRLPRNNPSFENTDRRAELKRALHQRVKDSLQEDSTANDDSYDEDAIPLRTPQGTWGRHEGTIQVSPRYLSEVLRRSDSSSGSLHAECHQCQLSEAYVTNDPATTLSRMLTQRASQTAEEFENEVTGMVSETPKNSHSTMKYVFDEDTPKAVSRARSLSPLGRSSTVLRSTSAFRPNEPNLMNTPFLHTLETLPSPDLSSVQASSVIDSVADNQWRLSGSDKGKASLPATLARSNGPFTATETLSGVYDTRIRPASESWLYGASRLLGSSAHMRSRSGDHPDYRRNHEHSCSPDGEESAFGGIDGKDDSPPVSIYHPARTRICSEGNEPTGSVHIYNMHVPSRLASQPILTSISYPQLPEPRRKRSFSSGGSGAFHAQPRRQTSSSGALSPSFEASSSGLPSPSVPMAWDNPHWRTTSSIYSSQLSQPGSLLSSQQSSLHRITAVQERLSHLKGSTPSEEIISVPAMRGKSIDYDKLEQEGKDTEYHSSNESLLQRELASADRRMIPLPRANTLPAKSRFKEELEQVSAEIALTNPFRRTMPNMDGNGEWNRASHAVNDNQATSIWEKALREHSQEDVALSHTRLGSNSPGPLDRETNRRSTSTREPSHSLNWGGKQKNVSVDDWHGSRLQARLAAYKLPAPVQAVKQRPFKTIIPSASVTSPPSWTRYPSHTRSERSMSPASRPDQVYVRDFANMTPEPSPERQNFRKITGSSRISQNVFSSVKQLYRTQSQELQRRLANEARGHRSSVSEGGVLEYPELEMLGTRSPPMPSPDINAKVEMEEMSRKASQSKVSAIDIDIDANQNSSEEGAKGWSKLYADCVVHPGKSEASSTGAGLVGPASEDIGPHDTRMRNVESESGSGSGSGSGSSELRASTLDFKKSLEFHEEKARERVLGPTRRYGA